MGKRFISSLLAVTMAASLAAGCGSASSDGNGTDTTGAGTDTASAGTEASTGAAQSDDKYSEENPYHLTFAYIEFYQQDDAARTAVQDAINDYMIPNGVSWGYYNNMTKQEPPVVWGIKNDEDWFFAMRMAQSLGISSCDLPVQSCFEIAGLDDDPFSVNYLFNWLQMPVEGIQTGETVKAVIRLAGGQTIVKEKIAR